MKHLFITLLILGITCNAYANKLHVFTNTHHITFDAEFADDDISRKNGLMFRKSFDRKNAMIFSYDTPRIVYMWMKNTYIPLDILYIDKTKRITHIVRDAIPHDETPLSSRSPVSYAVEMMGGNAKKYGIAIGDTITIER